MMDDRTTAKIESYLDQRAAKARDLGPKCELSTMETILLVSFAGIGIDVMIAMCATEPETKEEARRNAELHARALADAMATDECSRRDAGIETAAVLMHIIDTKFKGWSIVETEP